MKQRLVLIVGLFTTLLLTACATEKKITPVPQIEPAVAVRQVWKNGISHTEYAHFAPQLVGEDIIDAGGQTIRIINAQTGVTRQDIKTDKPMVSGTGSDGQLFVVASKEGGIYAYAKNGQLVWRVTASTEAVAPAVLSNGRVLVRTIDGRITAYSQDDGKQLWQVIRPMPALALRNYAPVTAIGGLVFAGQANGQLVALLEENGSVIWEGRVATPRGATELERSVDVVARTLVIGQQVCTVAYQGRIACFSGGNGAPVWAREMSGVSNLATDGRGIFGVSTKGEVLAFDAASGQSLWHMDRLVGRELGAPAVFGRHLVFGDMEGYVYFVNKDSGTIEAIQRVGKAPIRQQPVVYNDNVIIKTLTGDLIALTA